VSDPTNSPASAKAVPEIMIADPAAMGVRRAPLATREPFRDPIGIWYQVFWLVLSIAVLVAAAAFDTQGQNRVLLPFVQVPLPELCSWKATTGIPCPGCGLTRSFVSLAHGRIAAAFAFHPIGPVLFFAVVFQLPFRAIQLGRLRAGRPAVDWFWLNYVLVAIFAALPAQWVVRLFLGQLS